MVVSRRMYSIDTIVVLVEVMCRDPDECLEIFPSIHDSQRSRNALLVNQQKDDATLGLAQLHIMVSHYTRE